MPWGVNAQRLNILRHFVSAVFQKHNIYIFASRILKSFYDH